MGRPIDLTGCTIGKLKVLNKERKDKITYYNCECECGTKKLIRGDALTKKNPTLSCGCINPSRYKSKDITGKRYGLLTAIKYIGKDKDNNELWECKCDCENTVTRTKNSLRDSKRLSNCGCIKEDIYINNLEKALESLKENNWVEGTAINSIDPNIMLKNNKSGIKGVHWDKSRKKWLAQIVFKGKNYHLGRYDNKEDAAKARKEAEEKLFNPIISKYK